jgi:hypothetical protein
MRTTPRRRDSFPDRGEARIRGGWRGAWELGLPLRTPAAAVLKEIRLRLTTMDKADAPLPLRRRLCLAKAWTVAHGCKAWGCPGRRAVGLEIDRVR